MERKHKISIPEPCQEDWNKMTPNENGRFCLSCSKTVVDFTSMMPEEIQHFFIQNQNEKICGRFRKSQLDSITIQIPSRVLYAQTNYHKMFLLALFVAMGTTLFSCQNKDGNKQKIDSVEIVQSHPKEKIAVTEPSIATKESLKESIPVKKNTPVKFLKPSKISCGETIAQDSVVEGEVFVMGAAIETKADFPNGINAFYEFFAQEFKTPELNEDLKDRIIVSFVIDRDGSLTSFQFPKNVEPQLETEITRVLQLSPKWIPGTQNGKKTRIKYSLPISFQ